MSTTTVNLGYVPKNRGEYSSTASYYKDNIVQYNGSSYICNPPNYDPDTAPTASITGVAPYDSDPAVPNTGWAVFCNDSSGVGEGVYDVSVDHTTDNQPKIYASLSAALNDIPQAKKKGGMEIRFIFNNSDYAVDKEEGITTQPAGTLITSSPTMVDGTYKAAQLVTYFSTLPTATGAGNAVVYYKEIDGTYTTWTITLQSSDNKYVQYRLMADSFSTTPSDWQGVDEIPTAGSKNLIKSVGVYNSIHYTNNEQINKKLKYLFIDTSNFLGDKNDIYIRHMGIYGNGAFSHAVIQFQSLTDSFNHINLEFNSYYQGQKIKIEDYAVSNNLGTLSFYFIADWGTIEDATSILEARLMDICFDNSRIGSIDLFTANTYIDGDDRVVSSKAIRDYSKTTSRIFTDNYNANKVIRHLFIDVSNYTGSYSLEGLYLGNIYNYNNLTGFQIRNKNDELIANKYFTGINQEIQEWTVNGVYAYAEFNWTAWNGKSIANIYLTSEPFRKYNDPRNENVAEDEFVLGAAGDSITESVNYPISDDSDPYNPATGTKSKSWAYYIAKHYRMKWYNYGNSGSTLGDCIVAYDDLRGFSKANGRYTQMANDLTHITIWFGWNDSHYGPRMRKQMWVQETYSNNHWYPAKHDSQYIGKDGYVTQEEYDAVNAVTGEVGGVQYNNSQEYWNAVYIGTPTDNTNKTFWGAWNIVLPYLINKYPYAKILLISPYNTSELMRQCVRDAAFKYGLQYYDFGKDQNQMFAYGWQDESEQGMIGNVSVESFRTSTLLYDGTHPNLEGNKYLYPSIGQKLMSL